MRKNHEPSLADRLSAGAQAKRALVEKARKNDPTKDPGFAERQVARKAAAELRDARAAERKAERIAEKSRRAQEKADAEAAHAAAEIAEREAHEAEIIAQAEREIEIVAERKAARDAKYAARKARRR
jgi:hypothetical protein